MGAERIGKIMKKVISLVLAMLMVATLLVGCGSSKTGSDMKYVKDKGKIIVGITDYAPMDYLDENGDAIKPVVVNTYEDGKIKWLETIQPEGGEASTEAETEG